MIANFDEMARKNGSVEDNGRRYILIEQAHLDDACYMARAICEQDAADVSGYRPAYRIVWNIIDGTTEAEAACDWGTADAIIECGELDVHGRIV